MTAASTSAGPGPLHEIDDGGNMVLMGNMGFDCNDLAAPQQPDVPLPE